MPRSVVAMAGCLFLSGMCALIYQVAWLHELRLVFGGSTAATGAVLAIFMAGLGLGNGLLGSRADSTPNPLRLYGILELMIAITAAATPFLIDFVRAAYIGLGGQTGLGVELATVIRLGLSALVLGLPTFLMGGTLPAAARASTDPNDPARRKLAVLYGMNTLGAVAGTLLSTFWLVEQTGVRSALWLAAGVNFGTACLALVLSLRGVPTTQPTVPQTDISPTLATSYTDTPAPPLAPPSAFIYLSAGCLGFVFLLMELVWNRMLTPLLGGTSFTFGLILAIALFGIGLGSLAYTVLFRERTPTLELFAWTCGLEALAIAIPFALGDRLAMGMALYAGTAGGFVVQVGYWAVLTSIVVLPTAIISGLQFPLLIALLGRANTNLGRQAGYATSCNTLGAILGSLAGGFGALPLLTAPGTWQATVGLLGALGMTGVFLSLKRGCATRGLILPAATIALALVCLKATGPTAVWRHSGIGVGRFQLTDTSLNGLRQWQQDRRRRIGWEAEGVESSVALDLSNGQAFFVNGKCDGNSIRDVGTQVMLGIVGALLHGQPESALVVGLGTGETAGWLSDIETMRRVDVVELEPAIVDVARRCAVENRNALNSKKVRLDFNDAREVLLTTKHRYDLIVSEPSNPFRAGISSLFTREFYAASRERLADGGLFVQWLQAYEIDRATVETVLATLSHVFPHVEVWQTNSKDMLLACSMTAIAHDSAALRQRLEQPLYREALRAAWRTTDLEGVLARHVAGPELVRSLARDNSIPLNTDDRNRLEYGFARTVGRKQSDFSVAELRRAAIELKADRPSITGQQPDWSLVDEERMGMYAILTGDVPAEPEWTDAQRHRAAALLHCRKGEMREAVAAWNCQPRNPTQMTETSLLALAHASLGNAAEARPLLDTLALQQPTEAAAIEALLAFHQQDFARSEQQLDRAVAALRTDPWCLEAVADALLLLPLKLAQHDRTRGEQMLRHLTKPLAGLLLDERRLALACNVANLVDPPRLARAIAAFEPHVPWTKPFLELRLRAYSKTGDPRGPIAERELSQFRTNAARLANPQHAEAVAGQ